MNNDYLQELIREVKQREGGVLLSVAGKTEAVVLSLDRYNQLLVRNKAIEKSLQSVLVTGGAGYVGAHLVRLLVAEGHRVTVLDNLSTGNASAVPEQALLVEADIRDVETVRRVMTDNSIDSVFHLAGTMDSDEATEKPVEHLHDNVIGTAALLQAMAACDIKKIIFSSTAEVYGRPMAVPVSETEPTVPVTPFGHSKLISEQLIDYYCRYKNFKGVTFRYFNACNSAFKDIVSDPHDHLIPSVLAVLGGKRDCLTVFGNDHDTFDGTYIRDYVHVMDVARAHVAAMEKIDELQAFSIYNVGNGHGQSVESIVQSIAEATGKMVPIEIAPRRLVDPPILVLSNEKIRAELGFDLQFSNLESLLELAD